MKTRVKVCCIANRQEARVSIEAGADALGRVAEIPSGPRPISGSVIVNAKIIFQLSALRRTDWF